MSYTAGLYCSASDRLYPVEPGRYVCDETGRPLAAVYDYQSLADVIDPERFAGADPRSMARFAPLLPFREADSLHHLDLPETPLKAVDAGKQGSSIYWKDETRSEGRSAWSRGSALVRGLIEEWELDGAFCTSPGPAGRSLAGRLGEDEPLVLAVPGEYRKYLDDFPGRSFRYVVEESSSEDLHEFALEAAGSGNWTYATPGWNPHVQEGLKTIAYEVFLQLDPDPEAVYVAASNQLLARAVGKGFVELQKLGWMEKRPRVVYVTPDDPPGFLELNNQTTEGTNLLLDENSFIPRGTSSIDATVSVGMGEMRALNGALPDNHPILESPTGLLGLAGYRADERDTECAVLVDSGLALGSDPDDSQRPPVSTVETVNELPEKMQELLTERSE